MREYQSHVESLGKMLGCRIVQQPMMFGMMYVESGYIEGPTINNQSDYLVMLHELGHFAYGHTQGRPPHQDKTFYFDNGVLKSEAQAWEWAMDRCIDPLTDESRAFMWDVCLGSYYRASKHYGISPTRLTNGNRGYITFVYDEPDNYFWEIKRRMDGQTYYVVLESGKSGVTS